MNDLAALLAEILSPTSSATVNERDAAVVAMLYKGNPRMMGQAAADQLKGYYTRVHLGGMATHLTPAGA